MNLTIQTTAEEMACLDKLLRIPDYLYDTIKIPPQSREIKLCERILAARAKLGLSTQRDRATHEP